MHFSGPDILECFSVKGGPVSNTAKEGSCMDEIETLFAEQPRLGEIIDFEAEIRGDHGGLRGAEIGSQNLDGLEQSREHSLEDGIRTSHDGYLSAKSLSAVGQCVQRRDKTTGKKLTLPRFLTG